MQIEFTFKEDAVLAEREEWRVCPASEKHEVSSFGRFRNRETKRYLRGTAHQFGYVNIGFTVNGKTITKLAHRLVAQAFIEPPSKHHTQVNHLNKEKSDNRAKNLEWVTPAENMVHAWDGRRKLESGQILMG